MQSANLRWLCVTGILYLATLTSADESEIVIVGAGAAGIAAASMLFENGFKNVTILEAENRIGGRVYTTKFHDAWIDLGGQWVHGQTGNIVFELAWPLGLLEIPQEEIDTGGTVYVSNGDRVPDSIAGELLNSMEVALGDVENSNDTNGSWGEYLERIANAEFEKYPTINETLARGFMKLFEGFAMSWEASDNWREISLRGQQESWSCNGSSGVIWKDKGYKTILDILMKKFPNPEDELPVLNNTVLNAKVVNVNYDSIEGKAVVKTSDGTRYVADHVIMTPSLGVLKEKYETLFTPQLEESRVKTIKGLAFGTAAKIYLAYDEPWWPDNFSHNAFVWNENDRREYENDPSRKWLVDIIGIYELAHKPKLLFAWLSGASARYMEMLPEEQVFNQTCELVNKFLGKSHNITRPIGMKRTMWYSNENFRGTYSFRSMESERADVWPDQLAAPLVVNDKPIVMFAGEATHSHYYGNVHGAIETGLREAGRLVNLYKNGTK